MKRMETRNGPPSSLHAPAASVRRNAVVSTALETAAAPQNLQVAGMEPVVMPREYLSFRLGAEEYGIDILRVQEIRSYERPTRIAGAPPSVKGVINLRGVIVPVVDLRISLNTGAAAYGDSTVVIILSVRNRTVGAVVDSVSDVLTLEPDDISPPPELSFQTAADHIFGIGCIVNGDGKRMLLLTDIEILLSQTEAGLVGAMSTQSTEL